MTGTVGRVCSYVRAASLIPKRIRPRDITYTGGVERGRASSERLDGDDDDDDGNSGGAAGDGDGGEAAPRCGCSRSRLASSCI